MSNHEATPPYEIGLVMAGAVSAGAYAAGVVDFLIEALDAWHAAKEERPNEVPDHEVRLKVIAGSSAGGMTGAIAAGALSGEHAPVTSLPGSEPYASVQEANPLYSAWVEQVDIRPMLGDRDLSDEKGGITSLLDASVLDEIAETAIDFSPRAETRAYVADPLHLVLTVTNLRGVPYDISFRGNGRSAHRTARHTDYKEFRLGREEPEDADVTWLNAGDPDAAAWDQLRSYGLATGAYPGGLAPRTLSRNRSDYERREWDVPLRPKNGASKCWDRRFIVPDWPEDETEEEYRFLAVDGGAMNNEPFELARRRLAGDNHFNPRSPKDATRSVLMVDPLPSEDGTGNPGGTDLFSVVGALFNSLITQARFKPDELILAQQPDTYSRYMIRPKRTGDEGQEAEHPIASGMLNGFGGFLSKAFRMHDFQLGRRNCQRFLQKHFVIPRKHCPDNPVFRHYTSEELDRFSLESDGSAGPVMPIIPLVGSARSEEFPMVWKTLRMSDRELSDLREKIDRRAKLIANGIVAQYLDGWAYYIARFITNMRYRRITDTVMDTITDELQAFDLYNPS